MKSENRWFIFAEEDLAVSKLSFEEGIYNLACFHSQQGVEKMLKGFLRYKKQNTPRTHFLKELVKLCGNFDKEFNTLKDDCSILDEYYIPTRYPDALPGMLPEGMPNKDDAREAILILEGIVDFVNKRT